MGKKNEIILHRCSKSLKRFRCFGGKATLLIITFKRGTKGHSLQEAYKTHTGDNTPFARCSPDVAQRKEKGKEVRKRRKILSAEKEFKKRKKEKRDLCF